MCRRAEEATKAYCELAGVLSQAPDPLPFLHALQPLQKSLAEVQRENKRLQLYGQAAESEASSASEAVLKNRELERQVAELQAELKEKAEKDSQLQQNVSKVEDLKREADQQRQESEQQIKRLREDMALLQEAESSHAEEMGLAQVELQRAVQQCAALQADLDSRAAPDEVAALHARIETLRHLVDVHEETEGEEPETSGHATSSASAASLHAILQARNRRLAADLQSLQQQLKAKDDAMGQMQDRLAGLQQEARHKAALVQSLERDLLQASQNVGSTVDGSRPASAGHAENGEEASGHHASGAPSSSLLSIITSQRDRFRGRVEQLEGEMAGMRGQLAAARSDLAGARADSVKLYEKIRYLQRFSAKHSASDGFQVVQVDSEGVAHPKASQQHRLQCGPVHIDLGGSGSPERDARPQVGPSASPSQLRARPARQRSACFGFVEADDEEAVHSAAEQRYLKAYEARFNPFAEFQQSEEVSRVKSLPVHDRAILSGTRLLLQNKVGRIFAAVYLTVIHVFVFVLIYYAALSSQPVVAPIASQAASADVYAS
ncbi:hypothetical protein COCSUDRAFT_83683 [Coccomyxa subellipsoidea C-169]|uniref:CASP C-terminal domain-containing protein n=1 Tax=Coccomyxa subellipsoidea (strain C-169) TaxID=574566 RepID=I0Z160_COCSC|nr:hypothetical protein COCSUDRAFT_83683 [Coccomyxa subellipsoidea C-169]EIE24379.1 hypothetical protein COCSUDRAFT_83683 [Coccomyxa subellipsoidea C-169]|eukprot:XP_005648923.1 hypothetical protein COCSUDRAFT_83683 [Coccomyxa subellipsoidea C-169]